MCRPSQSLLKLFTPFSDESRRRLNSQRFRELFVTRHSCSARPTSNNLNAVAAGEMHPGVESRACYLRRVLLMLTACLRPCSPSLSLRKFPRCETNSERRFRRHSAFNPTASHARARRATALQFVTPLSRSANAKTARSALGLDRIIPLSAHRRTHCLAKALNL
jgi:hypothetical protein